MRTSWPSFFRTSSIILARSRVSSTTSTRREQNPGDPACALPSTNLHLAVAGGDGHRVPWGGVTPTHLLPVEPPHNCGRGDIIARTAQKSKEFRLTRSGAPPPGPSARRGRRG